MTQAPFDAEMIRRGREIKARRFARAAWDRWKPEERAGILAAMETWKADDWAQFADAIGARRPSSETVQIILGKLREGVRLKGSG